MNILNFGGGAFVGTAYMVGSLLAFDQCLVAPEVGVGFSRKSFFDFVDEAGVSFNDLESRIDDVFAVMPSSVASGSEDVVSKVFPVAQGISGGSLLAWSVLGDVPLVYLARSVLEFDARVYFDVGSNAGAWLKALFPVVVNSAGCCSIAAAKLLSAPFGKKKLGECLFDIASECFFGVARSARMHFPSGFCKGGALENYVKDIASHHPGLSLNFNDFERRQKKLIVIAERLDYVEHMEAEKWHETEVYFGISPYDKMPIEKAIRASCSLPGLMEPLDFYDPVLKQNVQLVDGGVSKTIGFRKIKEVCPGAGVWVVFNPIVPHEEPVTNIVDVAEQILRRLIYNRKCAVWDRLEPDIKERVILFEGDSSFMSGLLAWPDMKKALWHGYWHGVEQLRSRYDCVKAKLERAGLSIAPHRILNIYFEKNLGRKEVYGC
ncbi:patatin-like phospholipase family protein [Candidatus Woesearchaeota archaeon]|nr:patatin-like phospholipase family protein [Candidatus Woesearchaeota archaeon]